jgi:hypothetical protein
MADIKCEHIKINLLSVSEVAELHVC